MESLYQGNPLRQIALLMEDQARENACEHVT